MSKNFTIRSLFRPAKARAKELQGLNVEGSVSVTSTTVGVPTQSAYQTVQNITNNYTTEVVGKDNYKGRINITDLLALTDVGANDMYLVYSSGSDESGWGTADFILNGETCKSGTFVQAFPEMSIDDDGKPVVSQSWRKVEQAQVKVDGIMKLDPMQNDLILIESTYNATSYDNLYGRSIGGLQIAKVKVYELDGDTYKPKMVETTGTYAGQTNIKTIVVPYARSYQSGGETIYKGGALSDADYERLMTSGGGSIEIGTRTILDKDYNYDFIGRDQQGLFGASFSLLYGWLRTNNSLPYFYSGHAANTVPSAHRFNAGLNVGTDGLWWYNGNTWKNVVPTAYGITIEWYIAGGNNYLVADVRNNTALEDYTDGTFTFTISIDDITDEEGVKAFLQTHQVQCTVTGDSNGVYKQKNLSALIETSVVTAYNKYCIKVSMPNMLYYVPVEDGESTYFGISFNTI